MAGVTSQGKDIVQNGKTASPGNVSHKCEFCGRKFMTELVLFRHMFVHARRSNKTTQHGYHHGRPQDCKTSSQKSKNIQEHGACRRKSVTKPSVCEQTVAHTEEFASASPDVSPCSNENRQDGQISSQKSKKNSQKCEICHQQFITKQSLFRHMFTHTGELSNTTIKSCTIGKLSNLSLHSSENCQDCEIPSQMPKGTEKCEVCGLKFVTKLSLYRHTSTHTGELSNPTQDLCQHSSKNPLSCKSSVPKIFPKCQMCGRKFVTKLSLFRHMFTHTGTISSRTPNMCLHSSENPQNCKICLQKSSQNSLPSLDFKTGTSTEELYSCPACAKKFTYKANLLKHVCFRSEERPHQCELCFKKFSTQGRFSRHLRTHTGELPYECDMCCKKYNAKTNLLQHLKIHKAENSS